MQVRLEVRDSRGTAVQDAARFLGAAPAAAAAPPKPDQNEADVMKLEHDSLQDEVTRLRTENAEQAQRIQQLERTIRIMQTRLNVTAPR